MINQPIPCSHTHFRLALNYPPESPGSNQWTSVPPGEQHNATQHQFCLHNPRLKKQILKVPMKFAELASPDVNVFERLGFSFIIKTLLECCPTGRL